MRTTTTEQKKNIPLSVKLPQEDKEFLTKIAKEQDRSVHFLMYQAIQEFIEREKRRQQFYEEALQASEHYKSTGLHTTHNEMKLWAESLGTDHERPSPVCHK
jgi:predicted transcriptional regulator